MALALLFAGQGAQRVGMGKSLSESSAAARSLYDEANSILGWDASAPLLLLALGSAFGGRSGGVLRSTCHVYTPRVENLPIASEFTVTCGIPWP